MNIWAIILDLIATKSRLYRPTIYRDNFEIKIAINGNLISILLTKIDHDFIELKIAIFSDLIAIYRDLMR